MKCEQTGCTKDATFTVYWPNQETKQCDEHAEALVRLGRHMGIKVPIVPLVNNK